MSDGFEFIPDSRPADMGGCYRVPDGIICLAPATVKFRIASVIHYVEPAHGYYSPLRLRKDGEVHARQWGEKHPFWEAYGAWERSGKRVWEDGFAVWGENK